RGARGPRRRGRRTTRPAPSPGPDASARRPRAAGGGAPNGEGRPAWSAPHARAIGVVERDRDHHRLQRPAVGADRELLGREAVLQREPRESDDTVERGTPPRAGDPADRLPHAVHYLVPLIREPTRRHLESDEPLPQ